MHELKFCKDGVRSFFLFAMLSYVYRSANFDAKFFNFFAR